MTYEGENERVRHKNGVPVSTKLEVRKRFVKDLKIFETGRDYSLLLVLEGS